MKNKYIITYIEYLYLTLIFLFAQIRNQLEFASAKRWQFMSPHIFGTAIVSIIVIIHCFYIGYKEGKFNNLKGKYDVKKCAILLLAIVEVHIILLLEVLKGRNHPYNLLEFPIYDMIIIAVVLMYLFLPKIIIENSMKMLSLCIFITAILGFILWVNKYRDTPYIQSIFHNPLPAGVIFLIGFWLPPISDNKIIIIITRTFFALSIIFTTERSVFLGLALSIIVYAIYNRKKLYKYKIIIIIFSILICVAPLLISNIRTHMLARLFTKKIFYTLNFRAVHWNYILNHFWSDAGWVEKLFGNGYDTVADYLVSCPNHTIFLASDNNYLTVLYEFGIIGLGMMICWIIYAVKMLKDKDNNIRVSAYIILSMVVPLFFYDALQKRLDTTLIVIPTALLISRFISKKSSGDMSR